MNKFLFDSNDKPFHTSAFAEVANGGSIGAVGKQSFSQRLHTDRNRSVVRGYSEAQVAQTPIDGVRPIAEASPIADAASLPAALTERGTYSRTVGRRFERNASTPLQMPNSPTPTPIRFSEPPARGYNPYQ